MAAHLLLGTLTHTFSPPAALAVPKLDPTALLKLAPTHVKADVFLEAVGVTADVFATSAAIQCVPATWTALMIPMTTMTVIKEIEERSCQPTKAQYLYEKCM